MARIPQLTPGRALALVALGSLLGAFSTWLGPWVAMGLVPLLGVAAYIARDRKKRPHRKDKHGEPGAAPEPPPTGSVAVQKRFDTSSRPAVTQRTPILPQSEGPIDWKALRHVQESETGASLTGTLDLARRALGCRTVALLLPGRDKSVVLRAWSTDRDDILGGATLQPGTGLLGQLLKQESSPSLQENNLPLHVALGIYGAGVHPTAIAAVRISIQGMPALAVADHNAPLPESILEDLEILGRNADLLLTRAAHLRSEMRAREIWQSLGRFERAMGAASKEETAHEELKQFLLQFGDAEAVFFVHPETLPEAPARPSDRWHAVVQWALGAECESAKGFRLEIPGRGVCSGAIARGEFLQRRIAPRDLVPFLGHGEPSLPVQEGGEAMCLPVSLGVEGRCALLALFTRAPGGFPPVQREILETALSSFGQTLSRLRAGLELEKLATRDGLTGLMNHRTFQSSFRRELLKARRTGSRVGLILTDIDFFKKVNDQHGHPAGDAVLRHVAKVVASQLREDVDIVARYGGEEFVCVLVGTTDTGAEETAERIRLAVESSSCDIGEPQPKSVTLSLGVCVFPDDAGTAEDLIEKADQALYRAKDGGRNRFERALSAASRPPE